MSLSCVVSPRALFAFALTIFFSISCLGQGESALPFLLISPNAEANGMGETSVAVMTDDPVALMANPAHLGMQSQRNYFSSGYNYADWLPQFQQSDLWIKTFAITTGLNLQKQFGIAPNLSLGFGYSRVYLNLGTFNVTGPDDPTPIRTFTAHETSDQYSFAAALDYWVKASVGVTFKNINSDLGLGILQGTNGVTTADAYDYGILLQVPLIEIISRLRETPLQITPSISPSFEVNLGLAKNNLGDERVFYVNTEGDPLPRYARAGFGLNLGVTYTRNEVELQPISFQWSVEANDILVRRSPPALDSTGTPVSGGGWEYQDGLGDIHFFSEVFGGSTNPLTIKKKGWEVTFFEFFSIRGGRFEEDREYGNRRFHTSGLGIRFAGIVKLLKSSGVSAGTDNFLGFVLNHIDIRYNSSNLYPDEANHPLSRTKFNSIVLTLSN